MSGVVRSRPEQSAMIEASVTAVGEPAIGRRGRRRVVVTPYLLIAPALVALAVGLGYPLCRQLVMSFQQFGLRQQFGQPPDWVGLKNYWLVVSDPQMWLVFARSVAFCIVCAAATMAVGELLALLMVAVSQWARVVVQVSLLLVWAMPVIVSMSVWQWLFDSRYGVVNWLLAGLGATGMRGYAWTSTPMGVFFIAGLIVVWMSVPLVAFMNYSALSQLDAEVLEAAALDGASRWRRFSQVQLPLTVPVLMTVGLLQIVWDLRVFTQVYVLQQAGGSTADTNLLGTYIYRLGIGQGNYGVASALATVVLLLTLALTWRYVMILMKQQSDAA